MKFSFIYLPNFLIHILEDSFLSVEYFESRYFNDKRNGAFRLSSFSYIPLHENVNRAKYNAIKTIASSNARARQHLLSLKK